MPVVDQNRVGIAVPPLLPSRTERRSVPENVASMLIEEKS